MWKTLRIVVQLLDRGEESSAEDVQYMTNTPATEEIAT